MILAFVFLIVSAKFYGFTNITMFIGIVSYAGLYAFLRKDMLRKDIQETSRHSHQASLSLSPFVTAAALGFTAGIIAKELRQDRRTTSQPESEHFSVPEPELEFQSSHLQQHYHPQQHRLRKSK